MWGKELKCRQVVSPGDSSRKEWRTEAEIVEDEASIEEIKAKITAEIHAGMKDSIDELFKE